MKILANKVTENYLGEIGSMTEGEILFQRMPGFQNHRLEQFNQNNDKERKNIRSE